jgi:hypothetical protein
MLCLCIREPLHVRRPAGKGQAGDFLRHRAQRRKCERGVDRPAHPRQINRQILKACAWMPCRRDVNREKDGRVHARRIRPSFDDHRRAGDGVYAKVSFSASLALHFSSTIPKHLYRQEVRIHSGSISQQRGLSPAGYRGPEISLTRLITQSRCWPVSGTEHPRARAIASKAVSAGIPLKANTVTAITVERPIPWRQWMTRFLPSSIKPFNLRAKSNISRPDVGTPRSTMGSER